MTLKRALLKNNWDPQNPANTSLCTWFTFVHVVGPIEFKGTNHVLKVTLGQTRVQLCLWKSFATVVSLETNFVKCRKLSTITHICDNGDHSALWTTGPQGRWKKKCIYLSSYAFQIEKEQPNENLEILPSPNLSCSKISARKFPKYCIILYPEAALLNNLGTMSCCIWSWEASTFYLFVFKPTPSVFTSSTLAFNTFVENSDSQKTGSFFKFLC